MKSFYLKWEQGGRTRITSYTYDGTTRFQGDTLHEFKCRCIGFGKREGLQYRGEATQQEWMDQQ